MRCLSICLTATLATSLTASVSYAQQTTAENLFREGVSLFARGEKHAACDRFERSYKLDPAPGTLYNLAGCHEDDGRLWQARTEYADLLERTTRAGKSDRVDVVRRRLTAIEARLPKIELAFHPQSNVAAIAIDGEVLATEAWHKAIVVDLGTHGIQFAALGRVTESRTVATDSTGTFVVEVPPLADSPRPTPLPVPPPAAAPSPAVPLPGTSPASLSPPVATALPSREGDGRRTVGFVVGVAGIAALGAGAVLGADAAWLKNQSASACGQPSRTCSTAAEANAANGKLDQARVSALASNIAFGAGLGAAGVAAYLLWIAPSTRSSGNLRILPSVGQHGGGLSVAGEI
jgi:hypothetical protein